MPIGMDVTVKGFTFKLTLDDLIEQLVESAPKTSVKTIITGIKKEEQPDGSPQKENSPSWKADKARRKVKFNAPLRNEGLFTKKRTYSISQKGKFNFTVKIKPVRAKVTDPKTGKSHRDQPRNKVAEEVQALGYKFFDWTDRASDLWQKQARLGMNKWFRDNVDKTLAVFKSKSP